jgi:hypothetical protein
VPRIKNQITGHRADNMLASLIPENLLSASIPLKLGFVTALEEPTGYLGGYLVTNAWGRPLEFRVSNPVQPNRVQQILYGDTLRPYIFADLIGKTLVEKTGTGVHLIITDCRAALDLRRLIEIPMVWLTPVPLSPGGRGVRDEGAPGQDELSLRFYSRSTSSPDPAESDAQVLSLSAGKVYCHPEFAADKPAVRKLIEQLPDCLDLAEPFVRIREAIGEARKMGVANRAA